MEQLNFSKIGKNFEMPDLLEMHKKSFDSFLHSGVNAAFSDFFPIESPDGSMILDFVRYELGKPYYWDPEEAIMRDGTYSAPLKVYLSLKHKNKNGSIKVVSEQDVTLCDLPMMTNTGSFVFNGAERIVVSQLHRSPGIIFEEDEEKKQSVRGKPLYFARIIPYRGAWVEFEFDLDNALWVRLDRKKKILATTFLRASGLESNKEILQLFYEEETIKATPENAGVLLGRYLIDDIVNEKNGELIVNLDEKPVSVIDDKILRAIYEAKIKEVRVIKGNPEQENPAIILSLAKNQPKTVFDAQKEIYKKMRGQDFEAPDTYVKNFMGEMLFSSIRRYNFSIVGRYKALRKMMPLYEKLEEKNKLFKERGLKARFEVPSKTCRNLKLEDIIVTAQYLLKMNSQAQPEHINGVKVKYEVDDIDHLGNRRVRSIGELLEDQLRIALSQVSRNVREKMNRDEKALTPRALVNSAPVVAIIRKFFGTSQLSQFMDQINPLAELTHKRRLSALGPGGLNRKRAGFEVRDVHYTHYGRVCPIETPEGANIGLIVSLSAYAKVNEYGLIETPYRKVKNRKITDEIVYMTANNEDDKFVAQANTPVEDGRIIEDNVYGRYMDDYVFVKADDVEYMDISPLQVFSISAALIPFLEHDDANRALMGSNMQRQAVPLLITEAPYVGTGIESAVAKDSQACVVARNTGKVIYTSANMIAIKPDNSKDPDVYHLIKYKRSNQNTCINQHPIVKSGDHVKKGQVIADGPSTSNGQLSLGKNMLVAFMCWEGYNYEDAILVSEKVVEDDKLTSIFIHEYEVEARDTKQGPEEITRDIPNVSAESLSHIDQDGIVIPSTMVGPGDILVCKVSPKGEQQMSPEERLLKVIFGKKADEVADTSLRVPPGVYGKVIGTRIFVRREKLSKPEEKRRVEELKAEMDKHMEALREFRKESLKEGGKGTEIEEFYKMMEKKIREKYNREMELIKKTGELPVTVNKVVKVYIALKRRLQIGDKLSGRHGNKGVVSKIMRKEDMPYLPDGTPVDIVLSPLGVPSRMNIGQILETMLGWAAHYLNTQMICPVFDGPKEEQVIEQIRKAKEKLRNDGVPEEYLPDDYCRITLYDGRTGEPFQEKVTIGYMYVLKLIHLVEDKVHARSIGPYSLITRQPLGGKALFGGQRFGEMEVWALEGYGAAYTLQEMLTVKSDDFAGRNRMYEHIIKGEFPNEPGVPESFKVLVKELQALSLDVDLISRSLSKTNIEADEKKEEKKVSQSSVSK